MSKQVLVVDDDGNTLKYLSALLREHGYDPVSARDGAEGLQKLREASPDLIVLDLLMPKKSGFVLFRQLRQDVEHKDIPVLILTGVTGVLEEHQEHQDETAERPHDPLREVLKKKVMELREEGLVSPEMFMDKPVDPDAFIAKVEQLIGR
jgi:two-component system alkaline phosphatase synthesis response regulator PhoP